MRQAGLAELSEMLSLSTEESLVVSGFSVERFVPALVTLIRLPSSMEVLLLAARALSSVMELFPSTAIPKAMSEHVVPSLCEKLMEIEYMDVAELALQILDRIVCKSEAALALSNSLSASPAELCAQYRGAVIEENGMVALLQFVDFFPLEIQRTAARVVSELCTEFPLSMMDKLMFGLPLISNLLNSFDGDILQSSCDALRKLSESRAFAESSQFAMMIASNETCESLVRKLDVYAGPSSSDSASLLSASGYTSILRFMSNVLSYVGSDVASSIVSDSTSNLRFVRLPPIVSSLLAKDEVMAENQMLRETLKLVISVLPIKEEIQSVKALPGPMLSFAHEILPLVTRVYDATPRNDLRYDCLGVINRSCLIIFSTGTALSTDEQSELTRVAAFLARVLRPKRRTVGGIVVQPSFGRDSDALPIQLALQIIEATLGRTDARDLMKSLYSRHGIPSAIQYYASLKPYVATETDADDEQQGEISSNVVALSSLASRVLQDYFSGDSSGSETVKQLRVIVKELQALLSLEGKHGETQEPQLLQAHFNKLTALFADTDGSLTAHEIAQSGLVKVLISVLSTSEGKEAFEQGVLKEHEQSSSGVGFAVPLIRCLLDAISSEKDAFSLETSTVSPHFSFASGNVASDLDQLTQHIKVRVVVEEEKNANSETSESIDTFKRNDGMPTPWSFRNSLRRGSSRTGGGGLGRLGRRGLHDTVVLVEPLARVETMEEFIAEKLFGTQSSSSSALDELAGRNRSDDEDDEGKDDDDEEALEESKERRVEAVYNGQVLPRDISILEAIVKFGVLGGSDDTSNAEEPSRTSSSRIWGASPHDISFRVVQPSETTKTKTEENAATTNPEDEEVEHVTEVAETKSPSTPSAKSLEADELWWDDVWDLLHLLKLIRECVGAYSDLKTSSKPSSSLLVDSATFVNHFVSLQVNRALMQPVRVVTNALPEWSFRMVREFPFVLDFETRYHFMYVTMCGTSRAIQYLCRTVWKRAVMEEPAIAQAPSTSNRRRSRDGPRSRTAALTNISRMVKLPRLKVRVARSRLLQSAKKLLAIYGGKKAVIEIEFLGEVGTGLGPTTEFFTLVCEEIQSKKLRMWRDDDPSDLTAPSIEDEKKSVEAEGTAAASRSTVPVRGYHRIAMYHCKRCKRIRVPSCAIHNQLLTHEKKIQLPSEEDRDSNAGVNDDAVAASKSSRAMPSIPQCAICLDSHDWSGTESVCDCKEVEAEEDTSSLNGSEGPQPSSAKAIDDDVHSSQLRWWILSDEEVQYLGKVFPRGVEKLTHPVLQCQHCETVNFPGTDAGIVEMDGDRMIARSGRRMFERDYRAVTKHVSPLCEGTPLKVIPSLMSRSDVENLVAAVPASPEVLEGEVESLSYLTESSLLSNEVGGGPAVTAPFGLFPRPYYAEEDDGPIEEESKPAADMSVRKPPAEFDNVLTWFTFLGRFVGQALLDERLLNLPFSRPFLRALRGETLVGKGVAVDTSLAFLAELDPSIATSLRYLYRLAKSPADERGREEVEGMFLAFTLVGEATIELVPGGTDVAVTLDSLLKYVKLNLDFLLDRSIRRQVSAFRHGMEQICGSRAGMLEVLDVNELESLCADPTNGSMWDRDGHELREHMVCDHGYTRESRAIGDLVSILCELSAEEQRAFVRFVTGANRLPRGGLGKLEPKLTVVRKLAESSAYENDSVLPSASTCTNYLKLPEYSTREVMKTRLLYCIREGQGSFHLS